MFLKKSWIVFIVTLLIYTQGFSQDCSVNFFSREYTGIGSNTGGSQGDRLTILPDSSMIMCNGRFITRVSKKGDVVWSKFLYGSGYDVSNAIADYDTGIVCVLGSTIFKFDTSGNTIYQKKINFPTDNITFSESFKDIVMLDNGDKVMLYEDVTSYYGGYLLKFDKDMTVLKWSKNIQYDDINFTNMVTDGSKIVLAGLSQEVFDPARFAFIASFDTTNGDLSNAGYFNCPNLGSLRRLYKGNGQYFLMGVLQNQSYAAGRYFYMRIAPDFNVLTIRRVVGFTDNFPTTFSFGLQQDNSFYGMIGRGSFVQTIFKIDKDDSVRWVKEYLLEGYPSDVQQNSEAMFFAGDWDYNAVGQGARSTFYILKTDFNGKVGTCISEFAATLVTNNYPFSAYAPVTLQVTDQLCTIAAGTANLGNYALTPAGCLFNSICNSVKLIGDSAVCNRLPVYFTGRRNGTCKNPVNWLLNPAADYTVVNDSTIAVNFTANGNYKIICKINDRCNEYDDSINVHVNLSGLLDMPGDSILCTGNTIKLAAGNQFKTYQWQDGSADSVFIVTQTGKYYITVKDYCDNTYSDTININPANFYFTIGNDTAKCNADSLTLSATPGFYNYQWSPPYNLRATNDSTVIVNPMIDTIYTAVAEKAPGCLVKDSIHVAALHSPPVFLGNDTSLCTGQSLLLQAGNGFSLYKWNTGDISAAITTNAAGTYFIKATAANGCSSADTLKILAVNPLPVFTLEADTTLCRGNELSYNFNLPGAAYLWNDGSNLNSKIVDSEGLYWLKVTQQGCSAIDTVNVWYKPSPVVYLGRDTVLCDGISAQLNAANNNATYVWQDGSSLASYIVEETGLYYVTADINGCKASDSVYISYKSKPVISLVKDTFICRGQQLILNPVTATKDNYLWQDGSRNVSLEVKEPGVYVLTASNECGTTTNSAVVDWGTCELYIPAAFTPNKDGINDLFRVKNIFAVREFSFSVYNRFGEKLFESNSMNHGWDGSYKGVPQNAGAYVWMISFVSSNNRKRFAKGTVLLVR